jgi:drug/metabolite transporter (DMT)-like permease
VVVGEHGCVHLPVSTAISGPFPLYAALAVVFAGVLHASWNAMAKATPDRPAAFALFGIAYAGAGAVAAAWAPLPAAAAWPWLGTSMFLHALYSWQLTRCYRLGDFNQVYPLSRGTAPLIVALVAATLLGDRLSLGQLIGVAAVCGGLGVLAFAGGGSHSAPAVWAALLTGVTIAAYTVLDGVGVRLSGSPVGYSGWLFLGMGPLVLGWAWASRRGELLASMRRQAWVGLVGGVISVVSYAVVLWAQTLGALAVVAALRETGVVTGALIGAFAFRERLGTARITAAAVVAFGVALINLR